MEKIVTSNLKLGIIAGGQLGKMLIQEANKWDISCYILDQDSDCPAGSIASKLIIGNHLDYKSVYEFGKLVDVLTYELENINIEALLALQSEGVKVLPDPNILKLIQDKGLQKDFYTQHAIPTSDYQIFDTKQAIQKAILDNKLSFPFVQKLRKGGYDGKGVAVIKNQHEIENILDGPCIVEKMVEISKEIAVIIARNEKAEIRCFPTVEMIFNDKANLVEKLICPSKITNEQAEKATQIAIQLVEKFKMVGLLAVEFFIDTNGNVLVNEVAPRPHNSGHHTIDSVITSQFEQHLRAILNLPLGSTQLKLPAVMINLLGESDCEGPVYYQGLTESLAIEGVKVHLYGKKMTSPNRKMGHVTVVSKTIDDAIEKAEKVKQLIKVKTWSKS